MARHFSRLLPLVRWRYLRWGLLIPALPLALWACNSHPLQQPLPKPEMQTDFQVVVAPDRRVDILFMVDNSPSMDPKQKALADNFPKMIAQLDALPDGRPDLHIGVVSSDMGAGGQGIGGNCNVVLGDRGLLWGNVPVDTSYWDPNTPMQQCYDNSPVRATIAPGSCWALAQNPAITDGCGLNQGARWIEDIQPPTGQTQRQVNYTGGPNALPNVFSCLAKGVGVGGCGFEHQLQAVRVALNPQQIGCDAQGKNCTDVNMANVGFLRSGAYLAIILITDEDDCSAEPNNSLNDNIFIDNPSDPNTHVPTETSSMRCATRAHICNGNPIPDYVDPTRGYTGNGFTANFTDCAPKDQSLSGDNGLLPLIKVQDMINSVIGVTTDVNGATHKDKILVSGIIGWPPDVWPLDKNDPNAPDWPADVVVSSLANTKYQIGKDATAIKGQQDLWDYMPICEIPSQTSSDGNVYKAYGGLRLKEFIKAFTRTDESGKDQVNTFSICKSNFTDAMTQIGQAIAKVLTPGCVPYPLIDIQPSVPNGGTPGPIQPECQAIDHQPCGNGNGCYNDTSILECKDSQGLPLNPTLLDPAPLQGAAPTPQQITAVLDTISQDQRPCWYLSYDHSNTGCPSAPNGQRISALRKTGQLAPPGTELEVKCLTCSNADPNTPCPRLNQ
jgi:hypothetical protein